MIDEQSIQKEFGDLIFLVDEDEIHINYLTQGFDNLNRYNDIKPYQYNNIFINNNKKYINASSINIFKEKYFIATQGPKKETIEDFWTLVDENNSNVIVMLCNEKENGDEKCSNYWSDKNKMKKYKIKEENIIKQKAYIIREIKLINNSTKNEKIVKQINFKEWPDRDIPDVEFEKIVDIFNNIFNKVDEFKKSNPIVIHCSAGVGRTGTFISIYCLNKEIKKQINDNVKEIKFSIFNLVRKIKEMRQNSVQTVLQYYFIYAYANYFLLKNNI